jgi:ATP-dependent helicase/nuclease subunit A
MAQARALAREGAAGEHRRLLYVAMTRAAQRLIVAGFRGANEPPPDNWATLIAAGLAPHAQPTPSWWSPTETILRLGHGATGDGAAASTPPAPPPSPGWASAPAPRELLFAAAAPARRVAGEVGPERLARIEEGRLAHRLMQNLPALAPDRRRREAQAFVAKFPLARPDLAERVLALLDNPALAPLFAEGSRAEIPFAATLAGAWVEGRIDRLAVVGPQVWIADFKTGAASVRAEYRRQLALYRAAAQAMFPGRKIRAFLLWIDSGAFEELPASTLDDAFLDWAEAQQGATSPS